MNNAAEKIKEKQCSICLIVKSIVEFHKGTGKGGRRNTCKSCRKIERKEFYISNKEHEDNRNKQYRLDNLEMENKRTRDYNKAHREERAIYDKKLVS